MDDWAAYLDSNYQAVEWDVICSGDADIGDCLDREISDRVRVVTPGGGLDVTCYLEGVRQRVQHASLSRFTFYGLEVP